MSIKMDLLIKAKNLREFVKRESNSIFSLGEYNIGIIKKKGRTIMTCTCFSGTNYCIEGICSHKIAVLLFLSDDNFLGKIKKVISNYKRYKELGLPVSIDCMIDDLETLKRIK